jgi:hypothetical protein
MRLARSKNPTRPAHLSRRGIPPIAATASRSVARNSRCTIAQSGTGRCSVNTADGGGYSSVSSCASSSSPGCQRRRENASARRATCAFFQVTPMIKVSGETESLQPLVLPFCIPDQSHTTYQINAELRYQCPNQSNPVILTDWYNESNDSAGVAQMCADVEKQCAPAGGQSVSAKIR